MSLLYEKGICGTPVRSGQAFADAVGNRVRVDREVSHVTSKYPGRLTQHMFAVNLHMSRSDRRARRQTNPDCLMTSRSIKLDCEDVVIETSYAEVAVSTCTLESGMHVLLGDF